MRYLRQMATVKYWFWVVLCWAPTLYAQTTGGNTPSNNPPPNPAITVPNAPSLGGIATNMLGPLGALTDIFYNICYILGGSLLLGSIVQYKAYRDNPSQVRFSRPVFLAILGLVFIALPYISQLSLAARVVPN